MAMPEYILRVPGKGGRPQYFEYLGVPKEAAEGGRLYRRVKAKPKAKAKTERSGKRASVVNHA